MSKPWIAVGLLLVAASFGTGRAQVKPGSLLVMPKPMPARPSFESHFNIAVPKTAKVLHYYGEAIGMDPSFAWHLGNVDDAFLRNFIKSAKLAKRPAGKELTTFTINWGSWWNRSKVEKLPEVYYSDGGCYVRAWVDRKVKEVWVEFINT